MIFIWGSGGDVVTVRPEGAKQCPICQREQPFSLILRYKYQHFYYIFGYSSSRKYFLTCDVCGNGQELKRKDVEPGLERIPVPFMRRFGCMMLPVLFVIAFILAVVLLIALEKKR